MGKIKRKKYKGDDCISSFDMRLWSLVQNILLKWQTLVIFKYDCYSVPEKKKGLIQFFVPEDCTFCYEIVSFLEIELEGEIQDPRECFDVCFPGVDVEISTVIHKFSGIPGHIDKEIIDKMAKGFLKKLKLEIKSRKK